MRIIAKHLQLENLKQKIHNVDTVCCFTGEPISRAVKLEDLVSDVFTDWDCVKHPSGWVSIDIALCISDVIPGKTRNNALRSYSFFADEQSLQLLPRESILDILLNVPSTPFRVAVTFNNKKHTAIKTVENHNPDKFFVTTDTLGNILFDKKVVMKYLPIMQKWYTAIPTKTQTSAQPTFFTKNEIKYGNAMYQRQVLYGLEKYEEENWILGELRGARLFDLLVFLINKSI